MSPVHDAAPYGWKTVGLFISSTFRDFHAERDYLVKHVLPELREWCLQWKLRLLDIDLRWGVTHAQAENGELIDFCLKSIDGSRPFFLCMLGDRYGSVPAGRDGYSLTHLEIAHAVLTPHPDFDITEQANCAFFYFRDSSHLPDPVEDTGRLGALTGQQIADYATTFFESTSDGVAKVEALKARIRDHYAEVGRRTGHPHAQDDHVFSYSPIFDPALRNSEDASLMGRITAGSLKEFGTRVLGDFKKGIGAWFEERIAALAKTRKERSVDSLESESDLQQRFAENRTSVFIGRTELVASFRDYLTPGSCKKVLAVLGAPGSGKSALLAHLYRLLTDGKYADEHPVAPANPSVMFGPGTGLTIPHFVGASPASTSLHGTLTHFCAAIKSARGLRDEIPTDIHKLIAVFPDFLRRSGGPTLLILDGLDQLGEDDAAPDLTWLPSDLPDHVRIIASTLAGSTWEALRRKTDLSRELGPLTPAERREIVGRVPSLFYKSLDETTTGPLLAKKETSNPLYLKVALEELRVFGSQQGLPALIASLPDNVVDLLISVLDRLEFDMRQKLGEPKGPLLVERLFCLLECSRHGLADAELLELTAEQDPDRDYLVILRQLRDLFFYRGELLSFFHRALAKAVRRKYFAEDSAQVDPVVP